MAAAYYTYVQTWGGGGRPIPVSFTVDDSTTNSPLLEPKKNNKVVELIAMYLSGSCALHHVLVMLRNTISVDSHEYMVA